jgi:hypothetical protein
VQGDSRFVRAEARKDVAMIEIITVFFGLFSAGIFLAHAFDGYRFEGLTKGRATMRNHDFVSDGLLAVTVASLLLLCSSLLAIAFA